jgi:protein TonB
VWTLRDTWPRDPEAPRSSQTDEIAGTTGAPENQSARGNLTALFSADDYPAEALAREEQGTVAVQLAIDERGRAMRCEVTVSSGSEALDSRTCEILSSRARFKPARDESGHPVADTYTQRITWRLEG